MKLISVDDSKTSAHFEVSCVADGAEYVACFHGGLCGSISEPSIHKLAERALETTPS